MSRSLSQAGCACVLLAALVPSVVRAADLFTDDVGTVLRSETISAEAFSGYVHSTSGEYVYNVPGDRSRLSQLNWNANALVFGGRVAVRPLDWLTIRGRGWASVESDGVMHDYDWLGGFYGSDSWTHRSLSPDTNLAKAWQADISAAATYWQDESVALTAIAGFRHYDIKWKARGGSYIYSVNGFRDTLGTLPAGQIGIAYQQTWDTPYLGLGASYADGDWIGSVEAIGSPVVMASDRDYHALRQTQFKGNFATSAMVGGSASLEYRLTPLLSLAGRVEYQRYLETKGATNIYDASNGAVAFAPKPEAGADAETTLVSLGIKARL